MIKINQQLSEAFNLAGLTDTQRQVVAMHLEGASIEEMGKTRKVTKNAIKETIKAARKKYTEAFNTRSFIQGSIENGVHVSIDVDVLRKIKNFSDEQQEALRFVAKGYDITNTAYKLSITESAMKQRIKRAKENLGDPYISRIGVSLAYMAAKSAMSQSNPNTAMKVQFY